MTPNYQNDGDGIFRAALYQWSARMSGIAFEMVIPALIGIGLDQFCGTVVLFTLLGVVLGMVLGFWQLIKIASENVKESGGVDKKTASEDNERL